MKNIIIFLICSFAFIISAHADDWVHWRGPEQNGVAPDKNLPDSWSKEGKNLLWSAPYGSRSTPLVMDGRVYLIGKSGDEISLQERVVALDMESGAVLWEDKFNLFHTDIVANRIGWANLGGDPETGYIYVHGVQGIFNCYNREGKIIWSRSLTEEFGRISGYGGRTNSPIVDGSLVIISSLNSSWGKQGKGSHRFLAMNKHTGEVVWWADPGQSPLDTTYSVPVIADIDGVRVLMCGCADGYVYALNVATGITIWSYQFSKRGLNSSVVYGDGLLYATQSEENIDTNQMGRVVCINVRGKGDITKTNTVWKCDGVKAGYTSPILNGEDLYVMDNSANIFCFHSKNGTLKWKYNYGIVAKGSGVYADGKIYIGEVGGKYLILKPRKDGCETINTNEFFLENGSPIEINGSPAVANGRVFLPTDQDTYCIALKEVASSWQKQLGDPSHLQVVPGESWIHVGESLKFTAKLFDDNGNFLGECNDAEWSLEGLKGEIKNGVFTPSGEQQQAGHVVAKKAGLTATARLRVFVKLPYVEDFEKLPIGTPPPGWITSKLKCQVAEHEGSKVLWKLADRSAPPFARMKAYIQPPIKANYTIQSDLKGMRKKRFYPDLGLINSRYSLILMGTTFSPQLRLVTYHPIPRLQKDINFDWKPNVWYTAKLSIDIRNGKALIRGKVWQRGTEEPQNWTIEMEDPYPNLEGSPGLYAYSVGITEKSTGTEVFFDNISITRNEEGK